MIEIEVTETEEVVATRWIATLMSGGWGASRRVRPNPRSRRKG